MESPPCSLHSEGEETDEIGKTGEGKEVGDASWADWPLSFAVASGHFAPTSAANRCGDVAVVGSLLVSCLCLPSFDRGSDKGGVALDCYVTAAVIGGVGTSALKGSLTCEPHSLPHEFNGKKVCSMSAAFVPFAMDGSDFVEDLRDFEQESFDVVCNY